MVYEFTKQTDISDSATLAVNTKAKQLASEGKDIINISAGIPDVSPHPKILEALKESYDLNKMQYPPVQGYPELIGDYVKWFNKNYESDYQSENCLVTTGGKHALYLALQVLLSPGDEVIVVSPYWVSYPEMIKLNGGKTVYARTLEEEEWKVEVPDLAELVNVKTKILILNNASNPTGSLYTREELKAILEFAEKNNIIVISDEVYSTLVYGNNKYVSVASFPEYKDNVIVVQSASKMFAITGLRVGFLLGHADLIKRTQNVQSHVTAGTSSISQHVVYKLLQEADSITFGIKEQLEVRKNLLFDGLSKLGEFFIPDSAMYAFLPVDKFSDETSSENFCLKWLEEKGIATVPGSAFGNDGYFRISFGVKEDQIIKFLNAIS